MGSNIISAIMLATQKYKITLYREVNNKTRYYSIRIYPTLFGEYLIYKEYGNIRNKKPTRIIKEYTKTIDEAIKIYDCKVVQKLKKGYFTQRVL